VKHARATLAALFLAVSAAVAAAQETPAEAFVIAAMRDNLAGIRLGQLASDRASSPQARELGERLVDDHVAANTRARALAEELGVAPPEDVSDEAKAAYEALMPLAGKAFDRAFLDTVARVHRTAIGLHEEQTLSGSEAVAAYARDILPLLREHLDIVRKLSPG